MFLLEAPEAAHAPAVDQLVADLSAGTLEDRAVLLNLREEDRVPDSKRAAFHQELTASAGTAAAARFNHARQTGQRTVPLRDPRPAQVTGDWWTCLTLKALIDYKYLSRAHLPPSRPPRSARLNRPIGRTEQGADIMFWISNATAADADDLRDRLGLCGMQKDTELYRIRIVVNTVSRRDLHIPTVLDAGMYTAWRRPDAAHTEPWGMTRHLRTDAPTEAELIALPHVEDTLDATLVGRITMAPSDEYLTMRPL